MKSTIFFKNTTPELILAFLVSASIESNIFEKSTDNTGESLVSECTLGEWSWTGFQLPLTFCNFSKQCRPWSNAALCGVWSGSSLFANVPVHVLQVTLFTWHWQE